MLRTKRIPLFIHWKKKDPLSVSPSEVVKQIEKYAENHKRYYERFHEPGQPMLDPYPRVVLIPGVGMMTSGKNLDEANVVKEIYEHSMRVQAGAYFIDRYESLPLPLAFEMEYWPLELYKLSLAPKEKELARRIAWVTGAVGAIGRAIVEKLASEGAHVVALDLDKSKTQALAEEINQRLKSKQVLGLACDVTSESSVEQAMTETLRCFGGIDFLVSNAGIAHVASVENLELKKWQESFDVNATGHFLISRAVVRQLRAQKMGGAIVFIASKNVLAPGKDFAAYSAAKSAQTQLARVLAIENGEAQIRVNIVHPDGVFDGSGLWKEIKKERSRSHGISPKALEKHYQNRNLMKVRVESRDVAESVLFLLSGRSAKTTGCMLTVDGGLREAFPR
jgi:NAD(P)-dependent dehydrogenase (short-subunit alcohol dehydrogenase family)